MRFFIRLLCFIRLLLRFVLRRRMMRERIMARRARRPVVARRPKAADWIQAGAVCWSNVPSVYLTESSGDDSVISNGIPIRLDLPEGELASENPDLANVSRTE